MIGAKSRADTEFEEASKEQIINATGQVMSESSTLGDKSVAEHQRVKSRVKDQH